MTDTDAHVPMGTVYDMHTAAPRTVQRDFDTALIPAMRVDLTELRRLRGVLDDVEAGILAYKAREAAEAAEAAAEAAADLEGDDPFGPDEMHAHWRRRHRYSDTAQRAAREAANEHKCETDAATAAGKD